MGRYAGPRCRMCRREGVKLFLKGDRCYSAQCPVGKRAQVPGQHSRFRRRATPYALRIREKQKLKRIYGVREAQFRRYVEAGKKWKGVTGEAILKSLEKRLDNVVYRCGFAHSRSQARELVGHGHILVNGRRADIASYAVSEGDIVEVRPQSRDRLRGQVKEAAERRPVPTWLTRDLEGLRIQMNAEPTVEEMEQSVKMNLIVEFYSR